MSQFPTPYPTPPQSGYPGQGPGGDPLAAAKRAAILMWVFGALAVLGGVLMAVGGNSVTAEELAKVRPEAGEQARLLESQLGISVRTLYLIVGLVGIGVGGVVGGVAFLVRRGGFGAVVSAMVLAGMLMLAMLFFALSLLVAGGAEGVVGLCMLAVPTAMLVYLFIALFQAARSSSQAALAERWVQAQRRQGPQQRPFAAGGQGTPPHQPPGGAPSGPSAGPPPGYSGWGYPAAPPQYPPPRPPAGGYIAPEPPPGQPPVQFGYATRPVAAPQASGGSAPPSDKEEPAASQEPNQPGS